MHLLLKIICTAIYLVMFELLVRKLDCIVLSNIGCISTNKGEELGYGDWDHIFIILRKQTISKDIFWLPL
jgi:hypothetical protein